jgi:zinc/manganese transport system substrate-binding protein
MNSHHTVNPRSSPVRNLIPAVIAISMLAMACGGAPDSSPPDDAPTIVATTSILGDVVAEAFGDDVIVDVLMAGTQDPHSYRASPDDVARVREADLVVANGLGLEEALTDILNGAAADGTRVLFVGDFLTPLPIRGSEGSGGEFDPHFWFDPGRMERAVDLVAAELLTIDPLRAETWRDGASAYKDSLRAVDRDIREMVGGLPPDARTLVTNHDSLNYFADAYGFIIKGTVIPGSSTLAEPSASDLADLVDLIRKEDIRAVFADTTRPVRLAEVVADEVGHDVAVVELFTGSLGPPGSGADSYVGYLRTNAQLIVQALAG